ncbi:hypothetical protein EJ05DRAFT_495730 [Pseudovirgaria hyperparasitica]|uniref:Thioesterase domain-containing protein n=1 Tax=Pseudovirgaria hyperparasitica TaxID=470096 RepID=A0A6A6WLJ8_9PEZI|nr:uncharacterized protein EJ05DRAFT_495730 [Pseudovirgaria hyperparasitica]KAF2762879.1 hypothetical protein EJ05DRAFT_495730 [Pseudovirgaria hyperparasitica]
MSDFANGAIGFDVSIADPVARIQSFIDKWHQAKDYNGFDAALMRHIRIISTSLSPSSSSSSPGVDDMSYPATVATAKFTLLTIPALCNPMSRMHGGAVALLVDMATTMTTAVISKEGWWEFGGVSRKLAVTYLRPILGDAEITILCELRSVGKRLTFCQCLIEDEQGNLLAVGEHDKSALSTSDPSRKSKM